MGKIPEVTFTLNLYVSCHKSPMFLLQKFNNELNIANFKGYKETLQY